MGGLVDRVAVVTGASRGIGRAIAMTLAAEGARVILSARTQTDLDAVVTEIQHRNGEAAARALDLRMATAADELTRFALDQYGAIDIVVNNAGATKRGEFLDFSDDDWQDGFALKFYGAVRLVRAAWPSLKASQGSVLNIVGIGGRTPGQEFSIGGSVNAALLSLTKSLAELGLQDGVQVNALNPGPVRTDRLQRRLEAQAEAQGRDLATATEQFVRDSQITRLGEPEDIGRFAAFIVGPAGRFLHGALLDMDGGQTKTL